MQTTTLKNLSTKISPLILLAGGKSTRMRSPKGLLACQGKPFLLYHLDAYRLAGGKHAVVVLGYDADTYLKALPCLDLSTDTYRGSLKITTVLNTDPQTGPFSSIQAGLKLLLNQNITRVFVQAIDKPVLSTLAWHQLEKTPLEIKMAYLVHKDQNAHPFLISNELAKMVCTLDPETHRMDSLREQLPLKERLLLPIDTPVLNLNTPQEWQSFVPMDQNPKITALVGEKRSGKTTALSKRLKTLIKSGIKVGGIIQPASDSSQMPEAYFVKDIQTDHQEVLASRIPEKNGWSFTFHQTAFDFAFDTIQKAKQTCDVVVIDELGRLEAMGQGHLPALLNTVENPTVLSFLVTVRSDCVKALKNQIDF